MESNLTSSETTTESQSTDSADELTESVAAEMASSVNGSPGVEMGMSGDAIPVPEVEPEDHTEVNTEKIRETGSPTELNRRHRSGAPMHARMKRT